MGNRYRAQPDAASRACPDNLQEALAAVDDLTAGGDGRDRLWVALWARVTTKTCSGVTPMNSTTRVLVTNDYASLELIAAWEWLVAHEDTARGMSPVALERTLRGVATRSHRGSARAALADAAGGISNVPAGVVIDLRSRDAEDLEVAS